MAEKHGGITYDLKSGHTGQNEHPPEDPPPDLQVRRAPRGSYPRGGKGREQRRALAAGEK